MFVTAEVLNKGTLCSAEQPLNILLMFVTAEVLNKGTLCSAEQPLNILVMFVTACDKIVHCSRSLKFAVVPPIANVAQLGADNVISRIGVVYAVDPSDECLKLNETDVRFCPACGVITIIA